MNISLKKKNADTRLYNWRPNFRDYEELPDISVVRAKFFLPAILITAALILLSFTLFREYNAMNLRAGIAQLETQIAADEARHDDTVKLNSEFIGIVGNISEIVDFGAGRLIGSDFLLAISSRLVDGMFLTNVDSSEDLIVIEGSLKVPAEEASRIVDMYLKNLEEGDVTQGLLTEYKLTSLERAVNAGTISFRIEVGAEESTTKKKG